VAAVTAGDDVLRARIGDQLVAVAAAVGWAGAGSSDLRLLALLRREGPLTAGELARRCALSTGTTTGVLDRLERDGRVRRERDPHDRRKVRVVPVPGAGGCPGPVAAVLGTRDSGELAAISRFLGDLAGAMLR
jgi:MarR family